MFVARWFFGCYLWFVLDLLLCVLVGVSLTDYLSIPFLGKKIIIQVYVQSCDI